MGKQKRTEIPLNKCVNINQVQEAWGDRVTFRIDAADMPKDGSIAFVMMPKNYSDQPETVTAQPDGSGLVENFYSIGD